MKFSIVLEDTTAGVRFAAQGFHNGVTDHGADSLSAMYATRLYMMLQEAALKGRCSVFNEQGEVIKQ